MTEFSVAAKLECLKRELKMRQRVYSRLVDSRKMTVEKSVNELALMAAIIADYEALAAEERLV